MDGVMTSEEIGSLIDRFASTCDPFLLKEEPAESDDDSGVPANMQVGPLDEDGYALWKPMRSGVTLEDVAMLESQVGARLPEQFLAYLKARCHLFDQMHAAKYTETPGNKRLVMIPPIPKTNPVSPTMEHIANWKPLLSAGYLPVAEWGDGWGPVCMDLQNAFNPELDAPLVWFDHEIIIPMGDEACRDRVRVSPHAQALHGSFREFIEDIFQCSEGSR